MTTIFALSSGAPPAGIAIIRISGLQAGEVLTALAGTLPEPRRATMRALRDADGDLLDRALVLWMPGPRTVTGEHLAELHLHGGRAIVDAVEAALAAMPQLRRAEPGEFTRRAFANGRLDLSEAEGLADLLQAETELQRRAALALAEGGLSRQVEGWLERLLILSAQVEAVLDFEDEDDVSALPDTFDGELSTLVRELREWADAPHAERLRDGYRVVLAGPPNAGKSTLFNALVEDEAAITSPIAGTTRDLIERSVAIEGVPLTFVDTAGLHEASDDAIERQGMERANSALESADLVLWLGKPELAWGDAIKVATMSDRGDFRRHGDFDYEVSALSGDGVGALKQAILQRARASFGGGRRVALNRRQREFVGTAAAALASVERAQDPLITAEKLRQARLAFDALTGRASTEDMLDALFGRFCIGK